MIDKEGEKGILSMQLAVMPYIFDILQEIRIMVLLNKNRLPKEVSVG